MNKTLRTLLAATAMAVAMPVLAQAASVPSKIDIEGGNITQAKVERGLAAAGFRNLTYVQGEGRYWTVRGHLGNEFVMVEVDSMTGEVTQSGISIVD